MALTEALELRVHGDPAKSTLVYLPGLHGDWTLIGGFRKALAGRLRFVEVTYPRTLTWSLEDYATEVIKGLAENGISRGWLLGESFGSQVVWPMTNRRDFHIEGVILAGGFVRHPYRGSVRIAEQVCGSISLKLLTRILFGYAQVARLRFRHEPECLADIGAFLARRTEADRRAAQHRLKLVAENEPGSLAKQATMPIYGLTGLVDPVVPWPPVRRWLKRNCSSLRAYRIIRRADHNVLSTASRASADQIVHWMQLSQE